MSLAEVMQLRTLADAQQWQILEMAFTGRPSSGNPWTGDTLQVRFNGPHDHNFSLPAFYDGDSTWKVRFAPPAPGAWSYQTFEKSAGHETQLASGSFAVAPAEKDHGLFEHGGFLKVAAGKHHLTYSDGTPFFWLGDTWWFCPSDLVPWDGSTKPGCASTFRTLVDTRKKQGFTVIQMAFCGKLQGRAIFDFASARRSGNFDAAYWRQVDQCFGYVIQAGLIPVVATNWGQAFDTQAVEDLLFLWNYILSRYAAFPVAWLICGEYNQRPGNLAERLKKIFTLGRFIRERDPYGRALSVHPWGWNADGRQAWAEPWYDFIFIQGGHYGHGQVPPRRLYRDAWHHLPSKPFLEGEVKYEGIDMHHNGANTDADVRWAAYQAIQCGSLGFTYGSHGLWYPTQNPADKNTSEWGATLPWWEALERPGGAQMQHLRECYASVRWWDLTPCLNAIQTPLSYAQPEETMPVASITPDGSEALIYFPPVFPAAMDVLLFPVDGAAYRGTWFDPRTGAQTDLPALIRTNGIGQLALPQRPGPADWILIARKINTAD